MLKILLSLLFVINISSAYELNFNKDTICEVRNMLIYKHPEWASKITLSSGDEVFFSSPKNMFEFYFQPGRWEIYNITKESDFQLLLVTDFKTKKIINAKDAFYVYGSKETSPSGDDLVPFETKQEAEAFVKQRGGSRILHFSEVKASLINLLNNRI